MKENRKQDILNYLQQAKFISTEDAAELFKTSRATIRRDFNELAAVGLVIREHGGIQGLDTDMSPSPPLGLRGEWYSDEKRKIAKKAAEYIKREESAMIYGGSTTGYLGEYISSGTIITNLPAICQRLIARFPLGNGPKIIITGGNFDLRTGNILGTTTTQMAEQYICDVGFCSSYGMDAEGLMDINDECAALISVMMRHSKLKIVLADHSKFTRNAVRRCMSWKEIDILITTAHENNMVTLNAIRSRGTRVITI